MAWVQLRVRQSSFTAATVFAALIVHDHAWPCRMRVKSRTIYDCSCCYKYSRRLTSFEARGGRGRVTRSYQVSSVPFRTHTKSRPTASYLLCILVLITLSWLLVMEQKMDKTIGW